MAYVDGEAVTSSDLLPSMVEQVGSSTLTQWVLDAAVKRRLVQRGLAVTQEDLERERKRLGSSLSEDADESATLLREMRSGAVWGRCVLRRC